MASNENTSGKQAEKRLTFKGAGAVWDKEKNAILCKFIDGRCETSDKRVIDALRKAGFVEE